MFPGGVGGYCDCRHSSDPVLDGWLSPARLTWVVGVVGDIVERGSGVVDTTSCMIYRLGCCLFSVMFGSELERF